MNFRVESTVPSNEKVNDGKIMDKPTGYSDVKPSKYCGYTDAGEFEGLWS
jgi:hypothetical protein